MPDTSIVSIRGLRIWDSRGHPTVETEVRLAGGAVGRAAAPAGASRGEGEAVELRDGGKRFGGRDVLGAVREVEGTVARALQGRDATDQEDVDAVLAEIGGEGFRTIGGNTACAVSLAVLDAAAGATGAPRWKLLAGNEAPLLPLPEVQIVGGGAHAAGRLDVQDIMVMPVGADNFEEALVWTAEVYRATAEILADEGKLAGVADEGGFWPLVQGNREALALVTRAIERANFRPGEDIVLSLDIAANQLFSDGLYRLGLENETLEPEAFAGRVLEWCHDFPIASVEDPLAEHDLEGTAQFTKALGRRVQVVGDDLLVTDAKRVHRAAAMGAVNALLVKPNQAGTVSRAKAALVAAREQGWGTIVSARSGETEDVSVAHLAVGWSAGQMKVGSFARSERMAKWNEVLRIERESGGKERFAGRAALAPLDCDS